MEETPPPQSASPNREETLLPPPAYSQIQYVPVPTAASPTSVTALILSILAIPLTPFFGIGVLLNLLAIILGNISRGDQIARRQSPRLANIALIISYGYWVVIVLYLCVNVGNIIQNLH